MNAVYTDVDIKIYKSTLNLSPIAFHPTALNRSD